MQDGPQIGLDTVGPGFPSWSHVAALSIPALWSHQQGGIFGTWRPGQTTRQLRTELIAPD